jgi:hypothetical protein
MIGSGMNDGMILINQLIRHKCSSVVGYIKYSRTHKVLFNYY